MKIYFGDLVHTWEKVSVWTIPLNVGFVAAYTLKHFPDFDVRIFKDPNELLAACRTDKPDVVALSYYVWNENLDRFMFDRVKRLDPGILTVGGGPNFTVQNSNPEEARPFFETHKDCDAYVVDQGETGFVELIDRFREVGRDPARLRQETVPGCMTNALTEQDRILVGARVGTLETLDDIPSPYLTGLLDKFLGAAYVPLLETNRSCPYSCTFCALAVSTGSKLKTFGLDRVFAEIDYIAARTGADYLITTDANFGILERDAEIAAHLHGAHVNYNYPGYLCVVWNKTRPDRVMTAAKAFHGLANVGASMQSLQPEVLKAIKRKNLPLDVVHGMSRELQGDGVGFFSELICGLPEQTFDGHIDDNRTFMDLNAEIFNYNLRLLPGTEMNSAASREAYIRRTGWRLQANAFGVYDGEPVFEGEEAVLATSTMSAEELHRLRFIHFLLQYLWGKKFFIAYLQMFRRHGLHPMDALLAVETAMATDKGHMGEMFRRYDEDHRLEKFETYADMAAYWASPEPLERLRQGDVAKLNVYYGYQIVSHLDDFLELLRNVRRTLTGPLDAADEALWEEVLRFTRARFLDPTASDALSAKSHLFSHDFFAWQEAGYAPEALREVPGGIELLFYVEERKAARLSKGLQFFDHANRDVTLRTMFDTNPSYFLYEVRRAEAKSEAA